MVRYRDLALALALSFAGIVPAIAQTCPMNGAPGFATGGSLFGRIATQWNAYFASKVDTNGGTLCNPTIVGTLTIPSISLPNITGVGTLISGIWNATKIDIPYGGTNATTAVGARDNLGVGAATTTKYYAKNYGALWTGATGDDVGPAVQAAYDACHTAGGGTVVIPAGTYYYATAISNTTSGCKIAGAGQGIPRDTVNPNTFLGASRLVWNGAAGAGPGFFNGIANSSTQTIFAADVTGIVFDCASLLDTCVQIKQVVASKFDFGQAEARLTGVSWLTSSTDVSGDQNNDIWLSVRNIDPAHSATGVVFDSGPGANLNFSFNRIYNLNIAYGAGDGAVFANSDTNNVIGTISAYRFSATTTGSPVVLANSAYIPPSGVAVNGVAIDTRIGGILSAPLYAVGLRNGATLVAGGGNAGTGVIPTTTLSTNGTTAGGNATLHFASTTGVAANLGVTCGGVSSGVYPYTAIDSFTGTTVVMHEPAVIGGGLTGVASGQSCSFVWMPTSQAVAGVYTISATGATTFNITAPTGGHAQTGITLSSGVITFQDMVIPMTGTPINGDTWTVTLPTPSTLNRIAFVDKTNSVSDPHFENGATGTSVAGVNQSPVQVGPGGYSASGNPAATAPNASGQYSVALGGSQCTASGFGSFCGAGVGSTASNFYSFVFGQNNNATGGGAGAFGQNNTASGTDGLATGFQATDRGHLYAEARAAGDFAVQGDAQIRRIVLRGTGAVSGGAVRLTADGATAGAANCVNIPNNAAFNITVDVVGLDHTSVGSNSSWGVWSGLLTRGANAASTALTMATPPTPITNGTVTGQGIAATADTTNGCLNLTMTHPTNTDTWNYVARVATVEVQ